MVFPETSCSTSSTSKRSPFLLTSRLGFPVWITLRSSSSAFLPMRPMLDAMITFSDWPGGVTCMASTMRSGCLATASSTSFWAYVLPGVAPAAGTDTAAARATAKVTLMEVLLFVLPNHLDAELDLTRGGGRRRDESRIGQRRAGGVGGLPVGDRRAGEGQA